MRYAFGWGGIPAAISQAYVGALRMKLDQAMQEQARATQIQQAREQAQWELEQRRQQFLWEQAERQKVQAPIQAEEDRRRRQAEAQQRFKTVWSGFPPAQIAGNEMLKARFLKEFEEAYGVPYPSMRVQETITVPGQRTEEGGLGRFLAPPPGVTQEIQTGREIEQPIFPQTPQGVRIGDVYPNAPVGLRNLTFDQAKARGIPLVGLNPPSVSPDIQIKNARTATLTQLRAKIYETLDAIERKQMTPQAGQRRLKVLSSEIDKIAPYVGTTGAYEIAKGKAEFEKQQVSLAGQKLRNARTARGSGGIGQPLGSSQGRYRLVTGPRGGQQVLDTQSGIRLTIPQAQDRARKETDQDLARLLGIKVTAKPEDFSKDPAHQVTRDIEQLERKVLLEGNPEKKAELERQLDLLRGVQFRIGQRRRQEGTKRTEEVRRVPARIDPRQFYK